MIASMDGGGSERQTLVLLRHLDRSRFEPELFVLRRGGSLYDQIPADVPVHCFQDARSSPPSTRWDRLNWSFNWPGRIHRRQVAYLTSLLRDRSIDVIYDRTFHMTLIADPAAEKTGTPRVSTIVSPPSHAVPLNAGRFQRLKRRQLARAYARATATIGVSEAVVDDAKIFYRLPDHVGICIPNPVDAEVLRGPIANSPLPVRDRRYTIVCAGRMTPEKGHAVMIDGLAEFRSQNVDVELPVVWMIGDGPLRDGLEARVKQLYLQDNVRFLGHVDSIAPFVAQADLLCLPSTFEGFPNVVLEAMAIGTPVLASDIAAVRSLQKIEAQEIHSGGGCLATFASQSAVDLAQKLQNVMLDPVSTRARAMVAKRLTDEGLSIGVIVPKIEAIILLAVNAVPTT